MSEPTNQSISGVEMSLLSELFRSDAERRIISLAIQDLTDWMSRALTEAFAPDSPQDFLAAVLEHPGRTLYHLTYDAFLVASLGRARIGSRGHWFACDLRNTAFVRLVHLMETFYGGYAPHALPIYRYLNKLMNLSELSVYEQKRYSTLRRLQTVPSGLTRIVSHYILKGPPDRRQIASAVHTFLVEMRDEKPPA